ncbi:MAG: metallopeptidase family protein [Phycisphaerae bacterium]|nr:metallopeptidase family protein [Phycisphaerae bacterium]
MSIRLSESEFVKLVEEALRRIPDTFQSYLADVVVDVEPMPSKGDLAEMGLDDPTDLLGLYLGTPLTERSIEESMRLPDRVIIYQRNLEAICETREEIIDEVRRTVLHEVGHHFGLDEDDLEELGYH